MKKIMGIPVIGSHNKFQDRKKFQKLLYCTYSLQFPDGEQWIKQRPLAHDLRWELKEMLKEHKTGDWKNRVYALWKCGECWWKDNLGVEHLIVIEETKRMERWGTKRKDVGDIKTGLTAEQAGVEKKDE